MREDPTNTKLFLSIVKDRLQLINGWHDTFLDTKAFSFAQEATLTQSHLDRFYVSDKVCKTVREWQIESTGVPNTDHDLVLVRVAHANAPKIGKDRWAFPTHLLQDKTLRKIMHETEIAALDKINDLQGHQSGGLNPQQIYLE